MYVSNLQMHTLKVSKKSNAVFTVLLLQRDISLAMDNIQHQ